MSGGPTRRFLAALGRRKVVLFGAVLLLIVMAGALLAPWLAPHNPNAQFTVDRLSPPSSAYLLGTDRFGRDMLSRIMWGGRLSLTIGAAAAALAMGFGTIIGLIAGFYRRADNVLMRIMDAFMAFPAIVLAITLMAALGQSATNVVITLGIVYTPRVARLARSSVLVVRREAYVEAATALGGHDPRLLMRHILPNCASTLLVQSTFIFAYAVLGEAALSFLGVGVPPFIPTWGQILSEGRLYATIGPWMTLFPGLAIFMTILGVNLLGDGLRDALDPRMRGLT